MQLNFDNFQNIKNKYKTRKFVEYIINVKISIHGLSLIVEGVYFLGMLHQITHLKWIR